MGKYSDCWTYPLEVIDEKLEGIMKAIDENMDDVDEKLAGKLSTDAVIGVANGGTGVTSLSAAKELFGLGGLTNVIWTDDTDDFNASSHGTDQVVIMAGLISSTLYISFDVAWIRLQFMAVQAGTVKYRIKFGTNDPTAWASL